MRMVQTRQWTGLAGRGVPCSRMASFRLALLRGFDVSINATRLLASDGERSGKRCDGSVTPRSEYSAPLRRRKLFSAGNASPRPAQELAHLPGANVHVGVLSKRLCLGTRPFGQAFSQVSE